MRRRTKIIATLGPASDDLVVLEQLINAGVNVVRVNLSHGTHSEHQRRLDRVREVATRLYRDVGILADLQGPKIRVERFREGAVQLQEGQRFTLDAQLAADAGNSERVGMAYKELPKDVVVGDKLLLNDGQIELMVESVSDYQIACQVAVGGKLGNNQGINRQGGGLSAPALTEKDREDIIFAANVDVDYVAVSFPRVADDIHEARQLFQDAGGKGGIVAKIERTEAVKNIRSIIAASDAVMVARGDLGVEIGDAELPAVQKSIIALSRQMNCLSITATQMMESMVHNPIPTRAEVLDVANAVLDGTDAVMLSQETAVGEYPVKCIEAVARVCLGAEKNHEMPIERLEMEPRFRQVDQAIAGTTMFLARHFDVRAIVSLTESGATALSMSRIRSGIPIYALTRHEKTRRRVTLCRGVYPLAFDILKIDPDNVERAMIEELKKHGICSVGDKVVFTRGDASGVTGGTNTLKLVIAD